MRVLLDESLPRQLARELPGHDARTVTQQGWSGLKNGALLREAAASGFDVLLTVDRHLQYQQNLARAGLGVIVLVARTNRIQDLLPLVPEILEALEKVRPGVLLHVGH